jgi:2-polyprenyl-3-methyl-5-hydroxy-6-metoxy-1,4-benzoquinol methylase
MILQKKEITKSNYESYRQKYIVERCSGKRVLHIGACDWPYTKIQIDRGRLLYKKIDAVCKRQLGVDLDKESIDYLKTLQFENSTIIHHDMNKIGELDFIPEVIVFGETLEHLMNLEIAISNIKQAMDSNTELIISVPNALWYMNVINALRGGEHQHPDHSVAWTYKTLHQFLSKNNLSVISTKFAMPISVHELGWKGKIANIFVKRFPIFAGSLIVIAKL